MDNMDHIVESLHAHFAKQPDSRCLLVVDPGTRPLVDTPAEGIVFSTRDKVRIPIRHKRFPEAHQPYVIALDPSRYQDALLLRESVRIALEDREPDSMRRGHGQRIGGWISSTASEAFVVRHLSMQVIRSDEQGTRRALRFYDSRVMALLWPLLEPLQQRALLGPCQAWHALDASAALATYTASARDDGHFVPDANQWRDIHPIGIVNEAMAHHMARVHRRVTRGEVAIAIAAAHRAAKHGLHDEQDRVAFIGHALAWHATFDNHPAVQRALNEVANGRYYSAAIEKITPMDIEQIQHGSWISQAQGV